MKTNRTPKRLAQASRLIFGLALGLVAVPTLLVLSLPENASPLPENQVYLLLSVIGMVCLIVIALTAVIILGIHAYYNTKSRRELSYSRAYDTIKQELEWQERIVKQHRRAYVPEPAGFQQEIIPFRQRDD